MLPNLVIIGAMKAGTTSLHHYLADHPQISMSAQKELNFFVFEENWSRGVQWYESQFPVDTPMRGEASPDYTKFPRFAGVPARMSSVIPDAKLIYLVRDPIERIVSHYVDAYSFGREHGDIEDVLADLGRKNYLNCSKYYLQLEQYLKHYPSEQILIVAAEDLKTDRPTTLRRVFTFLDVDAEYSSPAFDQELWRAEEKRRNTRFAYGLLGLASRVSASRVRPYLPRALVRPIRAFARTTSAPIERPQLRPEFRRRLVTALEEDVARLREFTGQPFEKWSL